MFCHAMLLLLAAFFAKLLICLLTRYAAVSCYALVIIFVTLYALFFHCFLFAAFSICCYLLITFITIVIS